MVWLSNIKLHINSLLETKLLLVGGVPKTESCGYMLPIPTLQETDSEVAE